MARRATFLAFASLLCIGLTAAAIPAIAPAPPDIHTFRPSTNGFAFVNHFEGSPLPGALGTLGEGIGKKLGAPSTFGLCGGMSFAAADLFLAGRTPPTLSTQPVRGDALYDYIQKRQIESLGSGMTLAATFGRWMSLPDDGVIGTRHLSIAEVEALAASLDAGKPAVIGLVFNRHSGNKDSTARAGSPWENHQVLAYSITRNDSARPPHIDFHIYDPNYPKDDTAVIRCRAVGTDVMLVAPWGGWSVPVMDYLCERRVAGPTASQSRVSPVRGVISMPYEAKVPPDHLE